MASSRTRQKRISIGWCIAKSRSYNKTLLRVSFDVPNVTSACEITQLLLTGLKNALFSGYLWGACTGGRQTCALEQGGRDWSLLARSKLQFPSFSYARGVYQVCYLGRRQGCHQIDKRLSFPSSALHETLVFQHHHRYSETTSTSRCTAETVIVFLELREDKFYVINDEFWQVAPDKSKCSESAVSNHQHFLWKEYHPCWIKGT